MPKLDHHISGELHYRHKKGLLLLSQLGGFEWRDVKETLALYFGGVHYQHKKGLRQRMNISPVTHQKKKNKEEERTPIVKSAG